MRKLLVLHGPAFESLGLLGFLQQHFEVQLVEELNGALSAMRQSRFDAVLAETADFLPLERGIVTQQAAAVLDTIGDGVGIASPAGELVWANRRLRELPAAMRAEISGLCRQAYEDFLAHGESDDARGRRFSLMPDDRSYYEIICSPLRDGQGAPRQVAAVVMNVTHQRGQQRKLNAIDRAGRQLVSLDSNAIAHRDAVQRLALVEELIIRGTRDVMNYQHFAVLLLNERTNRLEVIIAEGLDEKAWKYELFANAEDNGICGYVAATGRSYVCPDVAADRRYLPGLSNARSSLTVPLRLGDKIVGVLNVESDRPGAFSEEDRQFTEIFGYYVALALNVLNLLVTERHTTHSRVSGSISAEVTGPINDIITEAGEIIEDYIGHDDLRLRLGRIVDRATAARQTMQRWSEAGATGVENALPAPVKPDPLLNGKRVLVADDEDLIRQTIRDVLRPYGCEVDVVSDGGEAKERIAAGHYDLVISDIKMPVADGYEVFAAAKARRADLPVVLITAFGYDPRHTILRARQEGLSSVLMKPFKVNQLLEECRAALSGDPSSSRGR